MVCTIFGTELVFLVKYFNSSTELDVVTNKDNIIIWFLEGREGRESLVQAYNMFTKTFIIFDDKKNQISVNKFLLKLHNKKIQTGLQHPAPWNEQIMMQNSSGPWRIEKPNSRGI